MGIDRDLDHGQAGAKLPDTLGGLARSNPKGYSNWFASRQAVVFERRKRAILETMQKQSVQTSVEDVPDFKMTGRSSL